jgi:hypothetical protein
MQTKPIRVLSVRCKVKSEHVPTVEMAIEKLVSAVAGKQPRGIRYQWSRLAGTDTFVGVLELANGVDNPLPGLPGAREFQENLNHWVSEPPTREELTLLASYTAPAEG